MRVIGILCERVCLLRLGFMKHVEESFKTVQPLLEHPSPDIRKAAVSAASQLCIAVAGVALETGDPEAQKGALVWRFHCC